MTISLKELHAAVKAKIITQDQANKLAEFLEQHNQDVPSFRLTHILYYFGGFLAISAITLFITQAWNSLSGLPLLILCSLFFALGQLLMRYFLNLGITIPAGIMATFSLVVVPLAIYNLQIWLGYPPKLHFSYVNYHYFISETWVFMELGTLLIGFIMFYFYRFPFLLFPISVTLWYMSMDWYFLFFRLPNYDVTHYANFSMYFGLMMVLYAFYVDIKHNDEKHDYAFWLYLFGVITFWTGLSMQNSTSELSRFMYCLINIAMILISVFLDRRVFAIFGALGVIGYLRHLSFSIFKNSLSFPILLIFLGILIILAATRWPKVEKELLVYLKPYIPPVLLKRRK